MASIDKLISSYTGKTYYVVRYRTLEGKSRKKNFNLKRDADKFRATVEHSKQVGGFVDPSKSRVMVGEWATEWLKSKVNLAATTRGRYEDIDRKYIQARWGNTRLSQVKHEDIQAWITDLSKELAAASIKKIRCNLSQIFDYAIRAGRLAINPANGCTLPRVVSTEKRYLTDVQVDAFAKAAGDDWSPVVTTLAYTGLRIGELAALRARNVDITNRRITVCESYSPVNGKMVLSDTKGHQRREVPILKSFVPVIEKQLEGKGPDDLVFTGPQGAILRSQTLQQSSFKKASLALGLCRPKLDDDGQPVTTKKGEPVMTGFFTPHEFRHTTASLAIASGANVKDVQNMLGHRSAAMTMDIYGHLFHDELDDVADKMDKKREKNMSRKNGVQIVSKSSGQNEK